MISQDTVAQVRERTNIVALISEVVPSLKKRGRSYVGLCPFHKEKSPSFHVNPDKGFFHCFGCKEGGGAIDFVMKHDALTFPEAVRALADRCGITIEEENRPHTEIDRQKKYKDDLYAVMQTAAAFYETQLREHSSRSFAIDELHKRGLVPSWAKTHEGEGSCDDVLQAFRIGYAPATWDSLALHLTGQGFSAAVAEQAGLLVPRSSGSGYYDRFRHRLMFAVVDPQGRVVAFSGRALAPIPGSGDEARDPPPKYVNSPESPIYTKGAMLFGIYQARHAIRQAESVILVEGNFDVVTLHAHGVTNVVAPLGTAFTDEQAKLLRRYASEAMLLFDADTAGKKAVRAARAPLQRAGLIARVATLPEGKDPDEYVREKSVGALRDIITRAADMLDFLVEAELSATFSASNPREKVDRIERVMRLIKEEVDPLRRSLAKSHADTLAGRLDIRGEEPFRVLEAKVRKELAVVEATTKRPVRPENARISVGSSKAVVGHIVGALIEFPRLLRDPEVEDACQLLEGEAARTVATLARFLENGGPTDNSLDMSGFLAQMPPPIQSFAARRLAAPELESADEARADILSNAAKLKEMTLRKEKSEVNRELREANDWEAETALAQDFAERVRQTRGIKNQ